MRGKATFCPLPSQDRALLLPSCTGEGGRSSGGSAALPLFTSKHAIAVILLHGSLGPKTRVTGRGSALGIHGGICIFHSVFWSQ